MKKTYKRIISLVLVFVMCIGIASVSALAATETTVYVSTFLDETGKEIELHAHEKQNNRMQTEDNGDVKVDCYVDKRFVYQIQVNVEENKFAHAYADGSVEEWKLDDIVTVRALDRDVLSVEVDVSQQMHTAATNDTDYAGSENLDVNLSNGKQYSLSGTGYSTGYENMGYRGGYYYAEDLYGYLQRKNNSYSVECSNEFAFTTGVTVDDVAAIISAFLEAEGKWGTAAAMLAAVRQIVAPIVKNYYNQFVVTFDVRTYEWLYRVRLNSYNGEIIYTEHRTKCYALAENDDGDMEMGYFGSKYDDGFPLSNSELIRAAIDNYIAR